MTDAIVIRKATNEPVGSVLTEGTGRVPHPDKPSGRLTSPPVIGWEDEDFAIVAFERFATPDGKARVGGTKSLSYNARRKAVVETWTVEDARPRSRQIDKALIVSRLTDAQLDAALAMMTTRQKERWHAPGYPSVSIDDPELLAVLGAVKADLRVVLAPEGA